MIIGGLEKLSLIDFPGHPSAIVFTQGCNFRCHFCYNPMIVCSTVDEKNIENHSLSGEDDFFTFLKSRQGKLEGVVVTGGEPTIHKDIKQFIKKIKDMGFLVKLDSNGTNPEVLLDLIGSKLLDYIAMDIKSHEEGYDKVVGVKADFNKISESVKIIMEGGVPYEFRTTLVPGLHVKEDIAKMGEIIKGADNWMLQTFKSNTDLVDKDFEGEKAFTRKELEEMEAIGKKYVKFCSLR